MATGTIKWLNTRNGLALIIDEEGNKIRVHFSVFEGDGFKTLKAGDAVVFDSKPGRRGPEATRVTKAPS